MRRSTTRGTKYSEGPTRTRGARMLRANSRGTGSPLLARVDRPRPREVSPARLRLAATISLVGAVLAAASAVTPWWYTQTTGPGASSSAEFYPGTTILVSGGGGGGSTSYAAQGLGSVADLYGGILGGATGLALLGAAVTVLGFGRSLGRWTGERVRRVVRAVLLVGLATSAVLAVVVPFAQPVLYRNDDPGRSCTSGAQPGPCGSFWGASHTGGFSTAWGAGSGWWLDLVAGAMLALALLLGASGGLRRDDPARPAREGG